MADDETLWVARVSGPDEGPWELLSPAVGWWSQAPSAGDLLGPGASLGWLRTLNRRCRLVLPAAVAGSVERAPAARVVALAYGDPLLRVLPLRAAREAARSAGASAPARGDDIPAGCHAVRAPTDGVFYQRPDPASEPFVRPGDRIRRGQPVGLVEVMKTFNHIAYGGPGLPEEAEVVELRRGDGEEVAAGELLLVVR